MTAAGSAGEAVTPGQAATELIAAERLRQIAQEGYTSEHDREHGSGDLAVAGAFYAVCAARPELADAVRSMLWPWGWRFSGGDAVRMLTKAGALIAAEIDRLQGTAQAAIAAQQPQGAPWDGLTQMHLTIPDTTPPRREQPAPELAAAEHRAELEAAVRELVGQHCRTVGPCRFCDGNTAGIMQLADTYAGLPS